MARTPEKKEPKKQEAKEAKMPPTLRRKVEQTESKKAARK